MEVKAFLDKVAYIGDSEIEGDDGKVYYSKFDGSYITRVGMEDDIKFLADREITEELTQGVGFSPKDNKWYGWSHRAIYGFTIGSVVKKGDCGYCPVDEKDAIENGIRFWSDPEHLNVRVKGEIVEQNGSRGVWIEWEYSDKITNKDLHGETAETFWCFPEEFGKGEWVAETMEDAKQMAIDFSSGVS